MAQIIDVCISEKKGIAKTPVSKVELVPGHGIQDDAHAGPWHRQVSLLAEESHQVMLDKGANVKHGDFGENIVTQGIDLVALPVGTQLTIGDGIKVRVTQIGKECHDHCAIYHTVGDCIMPRAGIFVEVLTGGTVKSGDAIQVDDSVA